MSDSSIQIQRVFSSALFVFLLFLVVVIVSLITNLFIGNFLYFIVDDNYKPTKIDLSSALNFSGIVITAISFISAIYLAFIVIDIFFIRRQLENDAKTSESNKIKIQKNLEELSNIEIVTSALKLQVDQIQKEVNQERRDITTITESLIIIILKMSHHISISNNTNQKLLSHKVIKDNNIFDSETIKRQNSSVVTLELAIAEAKLMLFSSFPELWSTEERGELKTDALAIAGTARKSIAEGGEEGQRLKDLMVAINRADDSLVTDSLLSRIDNPSKQTPQNP